MSEVLADSYTDGRSVVRCASRRSAQDATWLLDTLAIFDASAARLT